MALSTPMRLCSHHLCLSSRAFISFKGKLVPIHSPPFPTTPSPWHPETCFLFSVDSCIPDILRIDSHNTWCFVISD